MKSRMVDDSLLFIYGRRFNYRLLLHLKCQILSHASGFVQDVPVVFTESPSITHANCLQAFILIQFNHKRLTH